jgi:hypothetical protein
MMGIIACLPLYHEGWYQKSDPRGSGVVKKQITRHQKSKRKLNRKILQETFYKIAESIRTLLF